MPHPVYLKFNNFATLHISLHDLYHCQVTPFTPVVEVAELQVISETAAYTVLTEAVKSETS